MISTLFFRFFPNFFLKYNSFCKFRKKIKFEIYLTPFFFYLNIFPEYSPSPRNLGLLYFFFQIFWGQKGTFSGRGFKGFAMVWGTVAFQKNPLVQLIKKVHFVGKMFRSKKKASLVSLTAYFCLSGKIVTVTGICWWYKKIIWVTAFFYKNKRKKLVLVTVIPVFSTKKNMAQPSTFRKIKNKKKRQNINNIWELIL